MKPTKIVLVSVPLVAAIIIVVLKTVLAAKNAGSAFSFYSFYFEQNLDFTIAVGVIITQVILTVATDSLESQDRFPGRWEVEMIPTVWKGRPDAKVLGKGSMLLSKAPYSEKRYIGYMQLTYRNEFNKEIIRALYEVSLSRVGRKRVLGQSFLIWREPTGPMPVEDSPVVSWVRPCVYELEYDSKGQQLNGTATMQGGTTKQLFKTYKSGH